MKLVKYFLSKKPVTILLLVLVLAGGGVAYGTKGTYFAGVRQNGQAGRCSVHH